MTTTATTISVTTSSAPAHNTRSRVPVVQLSPSTACNLLNRDEITPPFRFSSPRENIRFQERFGSPTNSFSGTSNHHFRGTMPMHQNYASQPEDNNLFSTMMQMFREEREFERQERKEKDRLDRIERDLEREHREADRKLLQDALVRDESKQTAKQIRLPPYDEKEDIDVYIQSFEKIATLQKWDKNSWSIMLGTKLTGRAREIFVRMPNDMSYDDLKEALLMNYKLSAETYRKKFRTTRKQEDETFSQYAFRLDTYLTRWLSLSDKTECFDDLKDIIIYEQILNTANADLTIFLKERKPKSVLDAVELAENFTDARRYSQPRTGHDNSRFRKPNPNIHSKESRGSNNVNDPSKESEDRIETQIFKSRTQYQNNQRNRNTGCFTCGESSHIARDCPNKDKKDNKQSEIAAAVSLSNDLDSRYCYSVNINGVDTCALRDTGAQTMCVSKYWVPSDAKTVGQATLTFAEQNSRKVCPVVVVPIRTPFVSGKVQAVVMDNPVKPMIIGNKVTFEDGSTVSIATEPPNHERFGNKIHKEGSENVTEECMLPKMHNLTSDNDASNSVDMNRNEKTSSSEVDIDSLKLSENNIDENVRIGAVQTRAQIIREKQNDTPLSVPDVSIGNLKPGQISTMQRCDPSLDKYWLYAKNKGKKHRGATFVEEKMILFRTFTNERNELFRQIMVPLELRESVMKLAHDTPMAGHMGTKRTLDRIWHSFYWPGICKDVRQYCRSCDLCQKAVPKGQLKKVKLGHMPIIEQPFKRVGVDIIGPLKPMSERGFQFLVVMIDFSTRYCDALPLKRIDSVSVAEALFTMFSRVGIPNEILTDNGAQLKSEHMTEFLRLLGMKRLCTTPWHAQCNGLVERMNGTLKSMIKKLCFEKPKEWDRYIPAVLFAYREAPQESLQYSPFELLFGRSIRGPMSVLKDIWSNDDQENEVRTTFDHVTNLRERIEETCKIAHANLRKAQEKQERLFNVKTVDRSFKDGDMVLLLKPEKRNKMQMAWQGPYSIETRVNECDYRVRIGDKLKVYHANMLKPYETRAIVATAAIVIEESDIEVDDNEYEEIGVTKDHGIHLVPLQQTESVSDVKISDTLSKEQKENLTEAIKGSHSVFTDIPSCCTEGECDIILENEKPIFVRQYPLPHSQEETVKQEVEAMLRLGVIEPASSPFSSPAVLVKKKDTSVRFCIDFRRLNKHIRFDAEPMPDIDAIFAKLGKAKFFSKLDLTKGYWSIRMKEEDKCKTAFTTPLGQFQFTRMPFGLKTAGAIFSRTMRRVLQPLKLECLHNFMDDMLLATETWEEHIKALRLLLQRLEEVNMSARPKKCFFGFDQINFLGHVVGGGKMRPEEDKVEKLQKAERPQTKKQLRAFLGLSGYYRRFIPNYSTIALPLSERTKKNHPDKVIWNDTCEKAFTILKDRLSTYPIVVIPDQRLPFVLRTDASGEGVGAALLQDHGSGLQPIAYASKKLSPAERNYATVERMLSRSMGNKEILSIFVWQAIHS